jgi:hypothetical protein
VQNLDTANAIDVHVQWLKSDGTVGYEYDDNIPANTSRSYSTRYGDMATVLAALGNSYAGPVIVTTDSPEGIIGAVTNHILGSGYIYMGTDNTY